MNLIDWALEEPVGWWGDEQDVDTGMSVDDMKAVAAALDRDRWDQIDVGLSAVRAVRADRTRFFTSEDEDLEFTAEDGAALTDYRESIVDAMQALESMSETLTETAQMPYWAREDF